MDISPAQPYSTHARAAAESTTAESRAETPVTVVVPADPPTLSPPAAARLLRLIRNVAAESDHRADMDTDYDEYGSRAA